MACSNLAPVLPVTSPGHWRGAAVEACPDSWRVVDLLAGSRELRPSYPLSCPRRLNCSIGAFSEGCGVPAAARRRPHMGRLCCCSLYAAHPRCSAHSCLQLPEPASSLLYSQTTQPLAPSAHAHTVCWEQVDDGQKPICWPNPRLVTCEELTLAPDQLVSMLEGGQCICTHLHCHACAVPHVVLWGP